jgi:hypothetical protein
LKIQKVIDKHCDIKELIMKIDTVLEVYHLYLPWLILLVIFWVFSRLVYWAKNRKAVAFVFGVMMQMFLPDPNVEQTIHMVQEVKKSAKKEQDENAEPKKS